MRRPLSDRTVWLLLGAAAIVAVVLLAVLWRAGPAEGSEQSEIAAQSDVGGTATSVGHRDAYAVGHHAAVHSASFRDLLACCAAGDWRYYASGAAAPWEYRWLLEVACGTAETRVASAGTPVPTVVSVEASEAQAQTCWPVLWSHGLIAGDPDLCYYACGGWVAAEDFGAVDNAFDAVLRAWGVSGTEHPPAFGVPQPAADTPLAPVTGEPAVDRWLPTVQRHFPPSQVAAALRVMACESEGNPNAKNPRSSASGLFQHLATYWPDRSARAGWGGADVFDPEANIAVAAWLVEITGGWSHWVCRP